MGGNGSEFGIQNIRSELQEVINDWNKLVADGKATLYTTLEDATRKHQIETQKRNLYQLSMSDSTEKTQLSNFEKALAKRFEKENAQLVNTNKLRFKYEEEISKKRELLDLEYAEANKEKDEKKKNEKIKELEKRYDDLAEEYEKSLTKSYTRMLYRENRDNGEGVIKSYTDALKQGIKEGFDEGFDKVAKKLVAFTDSMFDEAENVLISYDAKASGRLVGTGKTWRDVADTVNDVLDASSLVQQKSVLQNLNSAINDGISYNVEQRAFLNTIKEEITDTFGAFDDNLLRLIRLLTEDSTAARLGFETRLKEVFNQYFGDTSYLSKVFDSVSQALFEASSLLDTKQSAEFEYAVQKYLGALYESGVSDSFVNLLAQGIGLLGSGDVQKLQGTPIHNLLALAANNSGTLNYADLLVDGLDASKVTVLLESVVDYIKQIYSNTSDNNVVRSAFGNVFGLSVSDVQAIKNVNTTALGDNITYGDMIGVVESELNGGIASRLSLATMMDNVFKNLSFSAGSNLVNNPATYIMYKALNAVEGIGELFDINMSPLGVGTDINMIDAIKMGMGGLSLLSTLAGGFGSMMGHLSLNDWDTDNSWVKRGTGLSLTTTSGKSQSAFISGKGNDISDGAFTEGVTETQGIEEKLDDMTDDEDVVKVEVQNPSVPIIYSDDGYLQLTQAIALILSSLGYSSEVIDEDETIKALLQKVTKPVDPITNAVDVQLKGSSISLSEMAAIGSTGSRLNIGLGGGTI